MAMAPGDPRMQGPQLNEAFIQALAQILAQQQAPQGRLGVIQGDQFGYSAPRGHGMMTGHLPPEYLDPDQAAAESAYEAEAVDPSMYADSFPTEQMPAGEALMAPLYDEAADKSAQPAPKPKAKKGEFSDFFKALKAAKSGDKDVKKSFKDLAKQLATKEAGNAETTIATS